MFSPLSQPLTAAGSTIAPLNRFAYASLIADQLADSASPGAAKKYPYVAVTSGSDRQMSTPPMTIASTSDSTVTVTVLALQSAAMNRLPAGGPGTSAASVVRSAVAAVSFGKCSAPAGSLSGELALPSGSWPRITPLPLRWSPARPRSSLARR